MFENQIKTRLQAGGVVFGAAVSTPDELATQMAVGAGPDFLWIDTEHQHFGMESIRMLPVLARHKGVMPMVRVVNLDPGHIKKALDIGAQAVMVPQVDNPQQAALAARYSKYPPEGTRGVSPTWNFFMSVDRAQYLPHANGETMVVVQVESAEAADQVEKIAAVDGVDVVFAGPADLSAALGHIGEMDHPEVKRFLAEFPARVEKAGKAAGIALGGVDEAIEAVRQGYRFINFSSILWDGARGIQAGLARLRAL
ncbi:MAG: 4-hydroxy-2-oxo-heptane-1,7-dioate aldolase [Acidobacteria bacterium]|nr:4-hydroxy-2-oxo-heptane-1,7-dioate aldolase [Acidobacteriota bacterium]